MIPRCNMGCRLCCPRCPEPANKRTHPVDGTAVTHRHGGGGGDGNTTIARSTEAANTNESKRQTIKGVENNDSDGQAKRSTIKGVENNDMDGQSKRSTIKGVENNNRDGQAKRSTIKGVENNNRDGQAKGLTIKGVEDKDRDGQAKWQSLAARLSQSPRAFLTAASRRSSSVGGGLKRSMAGTTSLPDLSSFKHRLTQATKAKGKEASDGIVMTSNFTGPTRSQIEFFRKLDEKIAKGRDSFDSDCN